MFVIFCLIALGVVVFAAGVIEILQLPAPVGVKLGFVAIVAGLVIWAIKLG